MNFFKQTDNLSCGVCAINSILSMYGKPGIVFSVPRGTTPKQIAAALRKAGVLTKAVKKININSLRPKSIIYYQEDDHYVTVEQVAGGRALINDSLKKGPQWVDIDDLVKKSDDGESEEDEIGWAMETHLKI